MATPRETRDGIRAYIEKNIADVANLVVNLDTRLEEFRANNPRTKSEHL